MASPATKAANSALGLRRELSQALASCATEADIVQVLYAELHPRYGYDTINLQVLEREGWYHSVPIDRGVLQDVRRRLLAESNFARNYADPKVSVILPDYGEISYERGRGPGVSRRPEVLIWVPILHRGQAIGAISYQTYEFRDVPEDELRLLEGVHGQLGVVVSNAYLNEITRNQAVSLSALNAIARALSSTLDEKEVAAALHQTIAPLLPVEMLELIVPEDGPEGAVRALRIGREGSVRTTRMARGARRLAQARRVLKSGKPAFGEVAPATSEYRSAVWVPILEGEQVRGVLALHARAPEAYEESTIHFLEQVADEVSLALRNAWSFAASESQRHRMEVVNAVGRRLASSLDRWAIMRTLRDELANHLDFDLFSLATVSETPNGPYAEGYVFDSGQEGTVPAVPLATAGPSREAYETGLPVLIRRSPWARGAEREAHDGDRLVGHGALITFTRSARVATRSIVWVPVRHGDRISALLSLQSYRSDAFDEWHVQLLQDVAAHVSLALANADYFAALQTERRRLEALHVLEMGVAGASDERQISEAVFSALRTFIPATHLVLSWVDNQARLTGYGSEQGAEARTLEPVPVSETFYFRRMSESGVSLAESVPVELRRPEAGSWWATEDNRLPAQVVWVPVFQGDRVAGALSAQRYEELAFNQSEIQLLESAAPVVGIALRTVRLHRANEMALAHSVRIQEVAALAGHDLAGVVESIADQARTMFEAPGAACWAFDDEGRVAARASEGDEHAALILGWSGRSDVRTWRNPPHADLTGTQRNLAWRLIPLWYADRMVGAIGAVQSAAVAGESGMAPVDFARHAAIAIENARLAAETRGRIHTLEAVAAFTDLDITRPERTSDEMGRLIERALAGAGGALWLAAGDDLVRHPEPAGGVARMPLDPGPPKVGVTRSRARPASGSEPGRTPIMLDGELLGMLTAETLGTSPGETRRLMSVLAGQAALVLNRLRLVDALDRQAGMMNAILSHSPVGVTLEDEQGQVVYANPEIERIYGLSASSLVGTSSEHLLTQARAVVLSDVEAEPGAPLELQLTERGTVVQLRRVPIPGSASQASGILTLHEDVTREREILEAKDLMLRAIGHEVRSPAAAMKSTIAGLLQWDRVMEAGQRYELLEEAYDQSERLLSLVENQLIIAKLETRRFEPNPETVTMDRAMEQVLAVLRSRYGSRIEVIAFSADPDLPAALCEPTHLDQVLTNLVGNALEYTRADRVEVSARLEADWLEVTVQDNGSGLPPDRVEGLFEKGGPAGRNRARGGLGLGLYLSRLVVERSFGGRIWLERTGPQGTVFKFTVPSVPQAADRKLGVTAGR